MKNKLLTALVALIFLAGAGLMLYPTVSDHWNARVQSRAVAGYDERVSLMTQVDQSALLEAARAYNRRLARLPLPLATVTAEDDGYESLLNPGGNGVMGYVDIPKINVRLSIYHGVEETVLQVGMGHIPGTSLPVGGVGTHAALSGHTGLPSAKLLTDLDQLALGDTFDLHVLGEVLRYQVDQILVVEPQETDALAIDPDADLVTLVTCTPYGVNSHRLLVRGRRIAYEPEAEEAAPARSDASPVREVSPWRIALIGGAALLALVLLFRARKRG